jgi:hypothetical protein
VWRQSDGKPVSCLEKIKVLNQNIQEIEGLCADALEDGVLMGCDAQQIKAALHELIDGPGWFRTRQRSDAVGARLSKSRSWDRACQRKSGSGEPRSQAELRVDSSRLCSLD